MSLPLADAGPDQTFAVADLPVATVTLAGSGTPGTGGSSITGYLWALVSKPAGSACAIIAGGTTNAPQIGPLDVWGNYRLFLVVTDNLGNASANDILTYQEGADATARLTDAVVYLRVGGDLTGLEKPVASEQNWTEAYADLVGEVETLAVGTAPATTTTLGVIELDETPVSAGTPKAVTRDRVALSAQIVGKVVPTPTSGNPSWGTCAVRVPEAGLTLVLGTVTMADSGATGRTAYSFKAYRQSAANYPTNTYGAALATTPLNAPATANIPAGFEIRTPPTLCDAGDIISLRITGDADTADQGSNMNVSFYFERRI
jgi:hypothetical protein